MKSIKLLLVILALPMTTFGQITGLSGWDICLDPGHSQTENMGIYGYSEAEKNVRVAKNLSEMLLNETDIDTVYLTRRDDNEIVGLSQRSAYANSVGATWFHSIHSDATTMGADVNSTLLLWGQYNNGLEKVPNGGNAMSDIMIVYLTEGMETYTTYGSIGDCSFYGCGDWIGPYLSVNRNTSMRSELSEAGFHTNPRQNTLNMNADWKRLEARTFFWSILEFHDIERPLVHILKGIVSNADTGIPINSAQIEVEGRTYTTDTWESLFNKYTSDPDLLHNGFYYFEDIEGDSVEIIVSAEGYYGDTVNVKMVNDFFTSVHFKLVSSISPYIVSTIPEEGEESFSVLNDIEINFSRPMNETSVESTLVITPEIYPVLSWRENGEQLVIKSDSLIFDTDYSITVSGQSMDLHEHLFDGNQDGEGGDDYTLNFRTGSDLIPPSLISYYPLTNQKNVEIRPIINLTYDEIIDSASVTEDVFMLERFSDNSATPGLMAHNILNEQSILSFFPDDNLHAEEIYITRVYPGLRDLLGNEVTTTTSVPFIAGVTARSETGIENFESFDPVIGFLNWWQPQGSGSTTGINVPGTSHEPNHDFVNLFSSSTTSMQVNYDWNMEASDWLIRIYLSGGSPRNVEFDTTKTLQVYLFGDGSGTQFRFALDEGNASSWLTHEVSKWISIDWYGWQLVEWDLNDPEQVGEWQVSGNNGILDGSRYRIDSFQFTRVEGSYSVGKVFLDDLRLAEKYNVLNISADESLVPQKFSLSQNYPNPFNPTTQIKFSLTETNVTSFIVYDIVGRKVQNLVNERLSPGEYEVTFEAGTLASGTYFYVLISGAQTLKRKMVLLK